MIVFKALLPTRSSLLLPAFIEENVLTPYPLHFCSMVHWDVWSNRQREMVGMNCQSPSSPHLRLQLRGALESGILPKEVINMSPRPSYHLNPGVSLERTFSDKSSFCWQSEKAAGFSSVTSTTSSDTLMAKSSEELTKEIATLEIEIMRLERYLLSLYRTAFEQRLPSLPENDGAILLDKTGSPLQIIGNKSCPEVEPDIWIGRSALHHDRLSSFPNFTGPENKSPAATPKASSRMLQDHRNSGHHSLADHLGASLVDNGLNTLDRLSEDIVKCISSIYCKLANPSSTHQGFSVSSTSSLSSSSTFSPRNLSDSWSPRFNEEATGHCQLQGVKEESGPYTSMIEVLKICLDDDNFNYAARMLQNFRSLVKSLEKVDPRKMKREEKLAFWINTHNALVMHAYLAYGTHNYVKSTAILKAAYNIGGHCINAYVIQSSILGIRSHYSAPWLQTLLSPGKMLKTGNARHVYAMEYPEPLVHFALCSGAYSDPAVRVYRAKSIFQDLKLAKEEFIQSSVYIQKETKIILPKILSYFSKDMSLSLSGLLEVVHGCLSEVQQAAAKRCMAGRPEKYIYWLPQSSTFRYVIHRELAEEILSI